MELSVAWVPVLLASEERRQNRQRRENRRILVCSFEFKVDDLVPVRSRSSGVVVNRWELCSLFVVRGLSHQLVPVRDESLKGSELLELARAFGLEQEAVDERVGLVTVRTAATA